MNRSQEKLLSVFDNVDGIPYRACTHDKNFFTKKFTLFLLFKAVFITSFSFNLYIPSFSLIANDLHCTKEMVQSTLTSGIIGSILFSLVIGSLSDAIGRRNLIVYSQLCFALGSLASGISPSIEFLFVSRFFQGVGSTASMVLLFPIFSDLFEYKKTAVLTSYLTTIHTLSIVVSPVAGGYIATYYSWPVNFYFLATLGFLSFALMYLFLPETLRRKKNFSLNKSLKTYRRILNNKDFIIMSLVPSLMIGGFVSFIATGAFYFTSILDITPENYGLYQGGIMSLNCLSSYFAGRAIKFSNIVVTANIGISIFALGGFTFFIVTLFEFQLPLLIATTFSLYSAGLGFCVVTITAENMSLFPRTVGSTSAMIGFIRSIVISLCVSLASYFYKTDIRPIGCFILLITVLSLILYRLIQKRMGGLALGDHPKPGGQAARGRP